MEVKKNLNNVQRKMLDEIYMEQFKKRESIILNDRAIGLKKLTQELLKGLLKDKEIKKMMEAGQTFYELELKLRGQLKELNVEVSGRIHTEPELQINRYSGAINEFKEVVDYNKETQRITLVLSEKKKEMRAKIYGVAASYEEVDQEIKELLQGI
jgi:hypothetical protein